MTCSKNTRPDTGASSMPVRENSACRIDRSWRSCGRSSGLKGCGTRASHLRSSASICSGPNRSQIACSVAGSSTAANPLTMPTHVLLPVTVLLRRADVAAVIVAALVAKAVRRAGFRRIAAELARPAEMGCSAFSGLRFSRQFMPRGVNSSTRCGLLGGVYAVISSDRPVAGRLSTRSWSCGCGSDARWPDGWVCNVAAPMQRTADGDVAGLQHRGEVGEAAEVLVQSFPGAKQDLFRERGERSQVCAGDARRSVRAASGSRGPSAASARCVEHAVVLGGNGFSVGWS